MLQPARNSRHIRVDLDSQVLTLLQGDSPVATYPISSSGKGAGELMGSEQTPRGAHYVRACIGAGLPSGAVLVGRRPTGEIYSAELAERFPERDWILTRILWLCGLEPGRNRLGPVDSMRRYIYIHGTPDDQPMGQPASHGCIRMRNRDVVELFSLVCPGTRVDIAEGPQ